jgi:hypothetical protein
MGKIKNQLIEVTKTRRMRWAGHVENMASEKYVEF